MQKSTLSNANNIKYVDDGYIRPLHIIIIVLTAYNIMIAIFIFMLYNILPI
jgi:hypothetical protein